MAHALRTAILQRRKGTPTMNKFATYIFTLSVCLLASRATLAQQQGDGIWIRNAYYGEGQTFDRCLGHQPGNGQYHHHAHPVCLRAQLNDNLITVKPGRTGTQYSEKAAPWQHSPIVGWALDGYPVYGPYGFSDPNNASSAVKRIKSGFRLRQITQRVTLPAWAQGHHPNTPLALTANQYGPEVSDTFPLGRYVEDFELVTGVGDLDQYNGRFAVTPEFPNGTYAYYTTLDDNGSPAFPYIIGMQYYGNVTGANNAAVPAGAQSYFANGAYAQTINNTPLLNSWATTNSQQDARVISGYDPSAGTKTTWPTDAPANARVMGGVTSATKADTQTISFTAEAVYVGSNNLGSYAMGPWFVDATNGGVFMNWPSAQNFRVQMPRTPAAATTKRNTGLGAVGIWVNGVAVFNVLDGASYSNAQRNDVGGGGVRPSSIHVSSASFEGGPTSPGAIMSAFPLFGAKLATSTATTSTITWPTTLAGATVMIRDAAGTNHNAGIHYASPEQINYLIPENAATGLATVTITANGVSIPGAINIVSTYPNLFQFNGEGLAAALILRFRDGQQRYEEIFQVVNNALVAAPIDFGQPNDQLFLVLFGTGLGKSSVPNGLAATAKIDGVDLPVAYAGAQGAFAGLDQYNLALPRTLAGKGKVGLTVTVNGKVSNAVSVTFK